MLVNPSGPWTNSLSWFGFLLVLEVKSKYKYFCIMFANLGLSKWFSSFFYIVYFVSSFHVSCVKALIQEKLVMETLRFFYCFCIFFYLENLNIGAKFKCNLNICGIMRFSYFHGASFYYYKKKAQKRSSAHPDTWLKLSNIFFQISYGTQGK